MQFLAGAGAYLLPKVIKAMSSRKRKYAGSSSQRRKKGPASKYFMVPQAASARAVGQLLRLGAGGEVKSVDTTFANAASTGVNNGSLSQTPLTLVLNDVVPGSQPWQRVGRRINIVSIQVKAHILPLSGALTGANAATIRVCLVYDKQPNGAYPLLTDIFNNRMADGNTNGASLALLNPDNTRRFRLLRDWHFNVNQLSNSGFALLDSTESTALELSFYKKCNLPVQFDADAQAITSIEQGALYFIGYDSSNASAKWFVSGTVRIRYTDF